MAPEGLVFTSFKSGLQQYDINFIDVNVLVSFQDNENSIAVYLEKDNTPYILETSQGGNVTRFTFMDFRQEEPHDNHSFRVPEECQGKVVADEQTDKIPSIFSEWFQFVFWK